MNDFGIGIACGLVAAVGQSLCYVVSGCYVRRTGRPGWTLAAPQRLSMCLAYALLIWFFRPPAGSLDWAVVVAVAAVGAVCSVLGGDTGLFQMQKTVEPSRSSPLQVGKIPVIALFLYILYGTPVTLPRLAAMALVIGAAALLVGAGRPITRKAWFWLLVCAVGYAGSDITIGHILRLSSEPCGGHVRASFFALGVSHLACGVFALPVMAVQRAAGTPLPTRNEIVRYILPYGAIWLVSMVFLFLSFSLAGVLTGVVAQSSRGLISVVFGWFAARHGLADVESRPSRAVFIRRVLAALLTVLAMALFGL